MTRARNDAKDMRGKGNDAKAEKEARGWISLLFYTHVAVCFCVYKTSELVGAPWRQGSCAPWAAWAPWTP